MTGINSGKKKTKRRGRIENLKPWKPGQSGNPKGAPKRGESWAETIKKIGELDGPDVAQLWDTQAKEFGKLPKDVTLKQLVVMTVYASLLRDPSPGNWRELMERAEGRVKEQIEHSGSLTLIEVDVDAESPS